MNDDEYRKQQFEDHMQGYHEYRTAEGCPACEAEEDDDE